MTGRNSGARREPSRPAEDGPTSRRRLGWRRGADLPPAGCPYLQPAGDEHWALAGPASGDRCRAGERPVHVGDAYQAAVCRKPTYRSCPRYVDDGASAGVSPGTAAPGVAGQGRRQLLRAGIPSVVPDDDWPPDPARAAAAAPAKAHPPAKAPARKALGTPPGAAGLQKASRRITIAELIVLGLSVSIVFAFLFVGYAFLYRLQMRNGIEVAAMPAGTAGAVAQLVPTYVPTFTPTPQPTAPPLAVVPTQDAVSASMPRTPEPTRPVSTPAVRPPAVSPPTRVVIPKIDVDIPVIPVGIRVATIAGKERVVWSDVADAAAFHGTSAYPGNGGNTVINGHRDILGSVFRHLDRLEAGDQVILYVGDVPYPYFVTESLVVPDTFASDAQRAENAKLIGEFSEERLTLVTCTPVGLATHRLVVIARPLSRTFPRLPDFGGQITP